MSLIILLIIQSRHLFFLPNNGDITSLDDEGVCEAMKSKLLIYSPKTLDKCMSNNS